MQHQSREVISNYTGIHPALQKVVERHLSSPYQKAYSNHTKDGFERNLEILDAWRGAIILDSGCGTGDSSIILSKQFPNHLVIGADKSEKRISLALAKAPKRANLLFLRCELVDLWRLLDDYHFVLEKHYLLYPNPWPKSGHLKRRWYAHPVFQTLLKLGGLLEIRSNWSPYVDEFHVAVQIAQVRNENVSRGMIQSGCPLSAFEKKYLESGQTLHSLRVDLRERGR